MSRNWIENLLKFICGKIMIILLENKMEKRLYEFIENIEIVGFLVVVID